MATLVRFSLHRANAQRYHAAYQVLARLGFDPVQAELSPGGAAFPGAALGVLPGDPAEHARAAFVALCDASLEPVTVAGVPLLDSARPRACA